MLARALETFGRAVTISASASSFSVRAGKNGDVSTGAQEDTDIAAKVLDRDFCCCGFLERTSNEATTRLGSQVTWNKTGRGLPTTQPRQFGAVVFAKRLARLPQLSVPVLRWLLAFNIELRGRAIEWPLDAFRVRTGLCVRIDSLTFVMTCTITRKETLLQDRETNGGGKR